MSTLCAQLVRTRVRAAVAPSRAHVRAVDPCERRRKSSSVEGAQ